MNFDKHAIAIAQRQYFQNNENMEGMFQRVAEHIASVEKEGEWATIFYDLMYTKKFSPGGRVLAGAGTTHGNILNCFVQSSEPYLIEGTTQGVLHLAKKLALVTKVGGGNGLCLDEIPGKRDYDKPVGNVFIAINHNHADYEKVKTGTYMDLVHGKYVTRGYKFARVDDGVVLRAGTNYNIYVQDSVEDIWDAAKEMVTHLLMGEDVTVNLSNLRPEGTPVKGSGGNSSGPSSFAVEIFDNFAYWASLGGADYAGPVATLRYIFAPSLRVIRQGGSRRGAGMATMSVTHPDIKDFITCKDLERERLEGDISTFNISVLVTNSFMESHSPSQSLDSILHNIADHAWQTGEPGLIFIDMINRHNAMREALGDIKATNPLTLAA